MSNAAPIPFETTILVRDSCLCLHTQRAARVLARRFDEALKPFGINNGQFSLLMSLNRPQPAPMASVANLLGMDRTTLTAALKPLERRGLLAIETDAKDRRSRRIRLSDQGVAVLQSALPTWKMMHAAIEMDLPDGNAERLRADLRALASA